MICLGVIVVMFFATNYVYSDVTSLSDVEIVPSSLENRDEDTLEALNTQCLECICQSVSGCSPDVGCRREGHLFCGPFFISQMYWVESGKPGNNDNSLTRNMTRNFVECGNDRFCSEETVRGYMKRYARDCDGDGVLTCVDFALIHKNGPTGCRRPEKRSGTYYSTFMQCFENTHTPDIDPRGHYHAIQPR